MLIISEFMIHFHFIFVTVFQGTFQLFNSFRLQSGMTPQVCALVSPEFYLCKSDAQSAALCSILQTVAV